MIEIEYMRKFDEEIYKLVDDKFNKFPEKIV